MSDIILGIIEKCAFSECDNVAEYFIAPCFPKGDELKPFYYCEAHKASYPAFTQSVFIPFNYLEWAYLSDEVFEYK